MGFYRLDQIRQRDISVLEEKTGFTAEETLKK